MPDYPAQNDPETFWRYSDIASIAVNIEALTRDMYDQIDAVIDSNSDEAYNDRLRNVLADLVDASENYTDAVDNGTDWVDSLDELFYLESEMNLARQTLQTYSKRSLVRADQRALKNYVEALLWTYKVRSNPN